MKKIDEHVEQRLAYYDAILSIAHALALTKVGKLADHEFAICQQAFKEQILLAENGEMKVAIQEPAPFKHIDVYLKNRLGQLFTKLQTDFSSFNRLLIGLRLYLREALLDIMEAFINIENAIDTFFLFKSSYILLDHYSIPIGSDYHKYMAALLGFHPRGMFLISTKIETMILLTLLQAMRDIRATSIETMKHSVEKLLSFEKLDPDQLNKLQEYALKTIDGVDQASKILNQALKELQSHKGNHYSASYQKWCHMKRHSWQSALARLTV